MSVQPSSSSSFVYDPNRPGFDEDPHPVYDHMRRSVPVYWWPEARGWVVSRYRDVNALLRDPRMSVEVKDWEHAPPELPEEQQTTHQQLARYGLFWMPAEDHVRVRRIASPLFTPRAIARLSGEIQAVVDDVLAQVEGRDVIDVVEDFAAQVPLEAVTRVLGIPRELRASFRVFGGAVIDAFYPGLDQEEFARKIAVLPEGVAMLEEIIADRRKRPGDDFLSALVHAEESGSKLSHKELLSMIALMISAGCEPPRHLICFSVLNLLRHPDQLQILREEPGLLRNAIDEVGRFDSFGKLNLPRYPKEDVEISGVKIRKGQQIFGMFASALRDPEVFPAADRFDIRRDLTMNLLYGAGVHACLGAALARLKVEAAVGTLFRRFPGMELAGPPTFTPNTFFRKMVSLPVRLRRG